MSDWEDLRLFQSAKTDNTVYEDMPFDQFVKEKKLFIDANSSTHNKSSLDPTILKNVEQPRRLDECLNYYANTAATDASLITTPESNNSFNFKFEVTLGQCLL